ncbi:baseplate J/gp47 family protein [Corallincola platygyrae]|uniref:Baseplate J/gp47 family protein n=1 Tax=Corallincola platygyrae TaxID=1193278 RepID=A0ABW4XNI6_9GAMM
MPDANADKQIVQLTLPVQGRSQDQRLPNPLADEYVNVDERAQEALFTFLQSLANQLSFYSQNDEIADGNWRNFFPFDEGQAQAWLTENSGQVPPHLALIKVFIDAYQQGPQAALNQVKQRYLDFYYQQVLKFQPLPAKQAHAHLVLTLKKQVSSLLITPQHQLSAGKREDKSEILVQPQTDALVNQSLIVEKRSVFRSQTSPGALKIATVADSLDGLGEALPEEDQKWFGFGHEALPSGEIGLALSSQLLRLSEGTRRIDVTLTLTTDIISGETQVSDLFKAHLSTQEGWTEQQLVDATFAGKQVSLSITLDSDSPAIIDYQAGLHGYQLDAQTPVLQLLVNIERQHPLITKLTKAKLASAKLSVVVTGMRQLSVKSDIGPVDPSSDFMPFGPQPKVGSTLVIGSNEAFSKQLKKVTAHLRWKSPPSRFSTRYNHWSTYDSSVPASVSNSHFTVDASVSDGLARTFSENEQPLFHSSNATLLQSVSVSETAAAEPAAEEKGYARTLSQYQSGWAKQRFDKFSQINPVFRPMRDGLNGATIRQRRKISLPTSSPGKNQLQLSLNRDFFHQEYRNAYVKNVLAVNATETLPMISEPYTPELSELTLDYEAYTNTVQFGTASAQAFANDDIRLFHLDCFGQRREHAYQRQQLDFVVDKQVSLLPEHTEEGALLLGLSGLTGGESCQLLFQVVDGSADPRLKPADIAWSVLCDNYWKALSDQELIYDNSNGLLTSGIVKLVIPKQATTEHSLMPTGLLWLKLAIAENVTSVCQLRTVLSNAIEVVAFPNVANVSDGSENTTYDPLPAGGISKFKSAMTEIKTVAQPFDGFGGSAMESASALAARVSERLRHKDRALSIHDYETLVLQAFPQLYRVKAIPHARATETGANWKAPGHTLFLLLPYVNSHNAVDPLKPQADSQTLDLVSSYLDARKAMQAKIHVRNPQYLAVRLSFEVQFKTGYEFSYYQQQLQSALQTYLSPWLDEGSPGPEFGGVIYKSILMDFIEELPYVDFITQVALQTTTDGETYSADAHRVTPTSPMQILTSDSAHIIKGVAND